MKEITIQCKQFDEWDKETQKKILNKHKDINVEYDWWEFSYDDFKRKLNEEGYLNVEISFSGFYSQGDGASFTCQNVDILHWLNIHNLPQFNRIKRLIENRYIDYIAYIKRDRWHHYVHWNTTSLYIDWHLDTEKGDSIYSNILNLLGDLEEAIYQDHVGWNKRIYEELEDEYNGLISDEAVIDTLRVNEYEFDREGTIW